MGKKTIAKPEDKILTKLSTEYYTTEQVAHAVGRQATHWCRIRHGYILKYKLKAIKIGRRCYYKKGPVNRMIEQLVQNGD